MSSQQKGLVKQLFDAEADRWTDWAYDPDESFDIYPTGKARLAVIRRELERSLPARKLHMLDAGCGSGDIALALEGDGHSVYGIDFAPGMITQCRERYKASFPGRHDAEGRFIVGDVENFSFGRPFDAAYAVGLLEYLESDKPFLQAIRAHLAPGGLAMIECRNRLFNAMSGNRFTLDEANLGKLADLVNEFDRIGYLSPRPDSEIPGLLASAATSVKPFESDRIVPRELGIQIPAEIQRRMFSPLQFEAIADENGFVLDRVIYYHLHWLPPRFEGAFPRFYNALSLATLGIGETSAGAFLGSCFLAILKKRKD